MKEEFDRGEKGRETKKKRTKRKEDGRVNGNSTTNFSCKRAAFFWHTGEFIDKQIQFMQVERKEIYSDW